MVIPPTSDTLSWQIENGSTWLGYKPRYGDTLSFVTVQPPTTALALGVYEDTLCFTALAFFSPVNVRVWYLIYRTTCIKQQAQPGNIWLGQNYPNPVTGETGYRTTVPYMVSGKGTVRIVVCDALGREKRKVKRKKRGEGRLCLTCLASSRECISTASKLRRGRG